MWPSYQLLWLDPKVGGQEQQNTYNSGYNDNGNQGWASKFSDHISRLKYRLGFNPAQMVYWTNPPRPPHQARACWSRPSSTTTPTCIPHQSCIQATTQNTTNNTTNQQNITTTNTTNQQNKTTTNTINIHQNQMTSHLFFFFPLWLTPLKRKTALTRFDLQWPALTSYQEWPAESWVWPGGSRCDQGSQGVTRGYQVFRIGNFWMCQDYYYSHNHNNYDDGHIRDYMQPPPYSNPESTSPYPFWTPNWVTSGWPVSDLWVTSNLWVKTGKFATTPSSSIRTITPTTAKSTPTSCSRGGRSERRERRVLK